MKTYKWTELNHKGAPAELEQAKQQALAEFKAQGYEALLKARESTDAELADKLGMSPAEVTAIEELHFNTLAKHLRALGGDLEVRAVFPSNSFDLQAPSEAAQEDAA